MNEAASSPGLDQRLRHLAAGDEDNAWADFLKAEADFLRTVARDHLTGESLVDDVVQEAVIRIRRALPNYRSYSDAEARGWLRGVVRHVALDLDASERARRQREQRTASTEVATSDRQPPSELDDRMQATLRNLPDSQLSVINLHYFEGLSFADIAQRLRLTRHHVHVLHGRALDQLRQRLAPARVPALTVAALVLLLRNRAQSGEAAMATAATAAPASSIVWWVVGIGSCVAGLAVVAGVAWLLSGPPAGPVILPRALPPELATVKTPTADLDSTSTFIRTFKGAHPDWILTDQGQRLGDSRIWQSSGAWKVQADGRVAQITIMHPGDDLRMAKLTLLPAVDPGRTARLLVGTLTIVERPLRSGFRLSILPDPGVSTLWAGYNLDISLSPKLLISKRHLESAEGVARQRHLGLAADARDFHFLMDDLIRREPRMQAHEVCFGLSIYDRRSPQPQVITLSDVQVYTASGDPVSTSP